MALRIRKTDRPELIGDIQPGWSVEESATPHAIGDSTASVGGVSFSAHRADDSEFLQNKAATVYYQDENKPGVETGHNVSGNFKNVEVSGPNVSVDLTNKLSALNVDRDMPPIVGGATYDTFTAADKFQGALISVGGGAQLTSAGETFVYDSATARVVKYDSSNTFEYEWDIPTYHSDFTIAPNGSLYFTGALGAPVVYAKDGRFIKEFENTPASGDQSLSPAGFDTSGNSYCFVGSTKRIVRHSPNGQLLGRFGSAGTGDGQFSTTVAYTVADGTYFYVYDRVQGSLQRFTLAGTFNAKYSIPGFTRMFLYGSNLLLTNDSTGAVAEYTRSGTLVRNLTNTTYIYSVNGTTALRAQGGTAETFTPGYIDRIYLSKYSLPSLNQSSGYYGGGKNPGGFSAGASTVYFNPITNAIGVNGATTRSLSEYSPSGIKQSEIYYFGRDLNNRIAVLSNGKTAVAGVFSDVQKVRIYSGQDYTELPFSSIGIVDLKASGPNLVLLYYYNSNPQNYYVGKYDQSGNLITESPAQTFTDPNFVPRQLAHSAITDQSFVRVTTILQAVQSQVRRFTFVSNSWVTLIPTVSNTSITEIAVAPDQQKLYTYSVEGGAIPGSGSSANGPDQYRDTTIVERNFNGTVTGSFFAGRTINSFVSMTPLSNGRFAKSTSNPNALSVLTDATPRLSTAFSLYMNRASGVTPTLTASSNPLVTYPGWSDNVWNKLNELCAATNTEIALVNDQVIVRDIGSTTINIEDYAASPSQSISGNRVGRAIEIVNQNVSIINNNVVFDYTTDPSKAIGADIGEYNTTNIQLNTWLVDLQQPSISTGVIGRRVARGTYAVVSRDGRPVPADLWRNSGASVRVGIGADGRSIDVFVQGPGGKISDYEAPYSVGVQIGSGAATGISLVGTGVNVRPETISIMTGADPALVTEEVAQNINIPFITNTSSAYDRGVWAATYANGTASTGSMTLPMSAIAGLGLTAGSVFTFNKSKWRVMNARVSNSMVDIDYVRYATVADHDAKYAGQTIGQHDNALAALTVGDVTIKPLY